MDELTEARAASKKTVKEFEEYRKNLLNIFMRFAKYSNEAYSERIAQARTLFEQGKVSEANRILDMEQMNEKKETIWKHLNSSGRIFSPRLRNTA